ncbi:hypothetical protein BBP40_006376 [Aspergillus hancockii]|nr:hypothetical protein BBP40_006376 [Aspergillus hancockii]
MSRILYQDVDISLRRCKAASDPTTLTEFARTGLGQYIQALTIGLIGEGPFSSDDRKYAKAMRVSFGPCLKLLPNLRRLDSYPLAHECTCRQCRYYELREEIESTVTDALRYSAPPKLEALRFVNVRNSTIYQFSGATSPGIAAVIARLRYLSIRHRRETTGDGRNLYPILQYGENLCSVELHNFAWPFEKSRVFCHPNAPLRRLVLGDLIISSSSLSLTIHNFRHTLRYVDFVQVTLPGNTWEEPMKELARCPFLLYFRACDCGFRKIDCCAADKRESLESIVRHMERNRGAVSRSKRELEELDPFLYYPNTTGF